MRLCAVAALLLQRVAADFTLSVPNSAPCVSETYKLPLKNDGSNNNLANAFTVGLGASQVFNVSLWINFPAVLQLSSLSISIFADMQTDYVAPPGPQKGFQPCVTPPSTGGPPYPEFPGTGSTASGPCSATCTGGGLAVITNTAQANFLVAQMSAAAGGACVLSQNAQYWVLLGSSDAANAAFICGLPIGPPPAGATEDGGTYSPNSALVSVDLVQWPPQGTGAALLGFGVNAPAPAASASQTPSGSATTTPAATPSSSVTASLPASASWSATATATPSLTPSVAPSSTVTPSSTLSPSRTATPPSTGTTSPSPTVAPPAPAGGLSSSSLAGIVVPTVLSLLLLSAWCAAPALFAAAIAICVRTLCRRKASLTKPRQVTTARRNSSLAAAGGGGGGNVQGNTYADIMRAREALARQGGGFTGGGAVV